MTEIFLTPRQLSERWHLSYSTLERWRWLGVGPSYIKIGGRIRYRIEDIEAHEQGAARDLTLKDAGAPLEQAA